MSGTFDIRLATPADEPDIRALVGSVAMPGDVAVRFAREPDYFSGTTIMGDPCDVLVARHLPDGALAGIACRAERRSFVSGEESTLGYIGQIRIAGEYRGRWLVPRGARVMREMSPPGLLYFGVIASENPRAAGALVGARPPAGIRAHRVSGLTTCAIWLRRRARVRTPDVEVLPASADTLPAVVAFLRAEGPRRQFFPAYTHEDFTGGTSLRSLAAEDVLVARRDGRIVGTMAVWDQSAYKQDIVEAYGPALGRVRPLYDLAARAFGALPLTPPGEAIPLAFAACVCVEGDDPDVMRALISAAAAAAHGCGKAYLMLGLADEDPLLSVARRFLHITYRSDLYALSFDEDPAARLDGRVPYIEIAAL